MKRKLSIAALLLVTVPAFSQVRQSDIVSAGGGYVASESLSVSYTIGETAIGTLKSNDLIVVQGFQQGYFVVPDDTIVPPDTVIPKPDTVIPKPDTVIPKPDTTSISGSLANAVSVYPNPVRSILYVELSGYCAESCKVMCYDMTGRVVADEVFVDDKRLFIDMANMPQGAYFVKVVAPNGDIVNKKIMKY